MRRGQKEDQPMNLRRAVFIAACMSAVAAGPAAAQAPWPQQPPEQQQPAAAPSPWTQQQQAPPCVQEFGKLRDETQKRATAIQAAGKRKASAQEACALFNAFSADEVKMIKFAT